MKPISILLALFIFPVALHADPLGTALDTFLVGWSTGATNFNPSFTGGCSIRSDIKKCGGTSVGCDGIHPGPNDNSWIEASVVGPRTLSMNWRNNNGTGQLRFYVDGAQVYATPGVWQGWEEKGYSVPYGAHTLRWAFYGGADLLPFSGSLDCVTVSNSAPLLQWTEEPGYLSGGVSPSSGVKGLDNFVFHVKYADAENDAPASGFPKLHIKKNGVEISGSPFSMSYVSGLYTTGAIYSYSKVLSSTGTDYTYYFEVQDAYNTVATGAPLNSTDAPDVFKSALSWTGESQYLSGGLSPLSGDRNSNFIFRIKFTDGDNQAPGAGYPKLHIKQDGAEISGSPFTMNFVSGAYNAGGIYSYTKSLMPGTNYTYYFEAQDAVSGAVGGSPTVELDAPDVSNQLPVLAWTGEANYLTDGVYPKAGSSSVPSVFRVKYSDADNDAPGIGYPKLYVKKGATQIAGSPFLMTCTGTGYVAGVVCDYSKVLGSGDYTYRFEALDIYSGLASGVPAVEVGGLVSIGTDLPAAQQVKVYHGVFKPGQNEKTNIAFNTTSPVSITVAVYNNLGGKVKEIYRGTSSTGLNNIQWDGRDDGGQRVSSGVYTIKIEGGGINQSKRVIVVR